MRRTLLGLELPGGGLPRFQQLGRALEQAIEQGRLRPGAALPSSRALATQLGLHRNTVLAAYAELAAQGWIVSQQGRGTFVSRAIPRGPARPSPRAVAAPAYELPRWRGLPPPSQPAAAPPGSFALHLATPDPRLYDLAVWGRAYRRAIARRGRRLLDYGPPEGDPALRRAIADLLRRLRGLVLADDDVIVTRGSQQAIFLVGQALLEPGDVVAVEALGYRPAWQALARTGAELHPIAVDAHGLEVDALAALCARRKVRAVYLTPHHQYPTTVALSPARRLALLDLARRHRLALIEDDFDHEFHYDGRPLFPLHSQGGERHVLYVGTLSKILAPGLRVGFVVAPPTVRARLAELRVAIDRQGDLAAEAALAELLDDGEAERHVRRMRQRYAVRRDALADGLGRLGGAVSFTLPPGGLALWLAVDPAVDVVAWHAACRARGVWLGLGADFLLRRRPLAHLRAGFSRHGPRELGEATRRMALALREVGRRGP